MAAETTEQQTSSPPPTLPMAFIIGPPGAGKGTHCKMLDDTERYVHLSVGDYLRSLARDSNFPKDLSLSDPDFTIEDLRYSLISHLSVKDTIVIDILIHKLAGDGWISLDQDGNASMGLKNGEGNDKILLVDGFPRSLSAAQLASKFGWPLMVIEFKCDKETCKTRCLERKRSSQDEEEWFVKRYDKFTAALPSIKDFYKAEGLLRGITSTGDNRREISEQFKKILDCGQEVKVAPSEAREVTGKTGAEFKQSGASTQLSGDKADKDGVN